MIQTGSLVTPADLRSAKKSPTQLPEREEPLLAVGLLAVYILLGYLVVLPQIIGKAAGKVR